MNDEITKLLCERLYQINRLTDDDKKQIRMLIMDFFAAACAGHKLNEKFNHSVENVILHQGGTAESSLLFSNLKLPARNAAFLNSIYGHGAELDDGNKKAMGHVGVHIIPAVLALAEAENKTEFDVMLAIATGYEAYIRISSAAQPGMVNRSFHSTGMAGAPACAAACAKLLKLNADGIESAMSLACTMASGLLTYSESQQMIKPINPGKAAETGVFAARLAQAGIKGPLNCLEGPNGWFKAVSGQYDKTMFTEDFAEKLLIHECYFKLYPSCRHTHCGIEAALRIHEKIDVNLIERINVYIYPNAIKLAGQIKYPQNADETKFSIHYTLACGLLYGKYGVDYMNPPRIDAELLKIIDAIVLIADSTMENREKGIRGTRVEVRLADGTAVDETVAVPKGDPENPLKPEDIISKFQTCAKGLMEESRTNSLISYLSGFGENSQLKTKLLFVKGE